MKQDRQLRGHLIAVLLAVGLTIYEWPQVQKAARRKEWAVSKARRWYVAFLALMLALCVWLGLEGVLGAWFTAVAFACLIASVIEQDRRARRQRQGQPAQRNAPVSVAESGRSASR